MILYKLTIKYENYNEIWNKINGYTFISGICDPSQIKNDTFFLNRLNVRLKKSLRLSFYSKSELQWMCEKIKLQTNFFFLIFY